jgi:hypothetical protein
MALTRHTGTGIFLFHLKIKLLNTCYIVVTGIVKKLNFSFLKVGTGTCTRQMP